MFHSLNDLLSQGLLLALNREDAKRLFAAREPAALRQFLETLLDTRLSQAASATHESLLAAGSAVCDRHWQQIQQAFDQNGVADESLRPALRQSLTGGRVICDDPTLTVWLVRPDMVPHVASALKGLSDDAVSQGLAEAIRKTNGSSASWLEKARSTVGRMAAVYAQAAQEQAAVIFAVRPPDTADSSAKA